MEPSSSTMSLNRPQPPGVRGRRTAAAAAASSGLDSRNSASPAPASPALASLELPADTEAPREIAMEDMEAALRGLSREDLVVALKRSKEHMDHLDSRLEAHIQALEEHRSSYADVTAQLALAEAEAQSLHGAVTAREERVDELLAEQERADDELAALQGIVERLRKQEAESDRARQEAERRYADQIATADKERQFMLDTEALLKAQKASTLSANERLLASNAELKRENERLQQRLGSVHASSHASNGDVEYVGQEAHAAEAAAKRALSDEAAASESLRVELTTLQRSQGSLLETLNTLREELADVRAANVSLRNENEAYLDILQEKTLSGALVAESAVLSRSYGPAGDDDDTETETDEGDDTFESGTTGAGDNTNGDVEDVPAPKRKPRKVTIAESPGAKRNLQAPTTLANELEETATGAEERETKRKERKERRERDGMGETMPTEVPVLQSEVRELRDANKALTLYVSRIIDRIVAKQGFEDVLAIDDDRRNSRGTSSRLRGQRSRAQLSSAGGGGIAALTNDSSEKMTRRTSGSGLLSFARPGLGGDAATTGLGVSGAASNMMPKPRRTASIDWRNWLPGATPAPDPREAHLRPLALSPAMVSSARVRDDDEEKERERIRAHLEMQGFEAPGEPRSTNTTTSLADKRSSVGNFLSRVIGGSSEP